MEELQKFFENNLSWQKATFKDQTVSGILKHLEKEAREVREAIEANDHENDIKYEFADILILYGEAILRSGYDFNEIFNAALEKMTINRLRRWKKPDDDGVVEHIKE